MSEDDVDIDAIMNEIEEYEPDETDEDDEILEDNSEETSLEIQGEKELAIDLEEENALANKIVENSLDVIKNSKKVFENFEADVFHGKDRSTSSKEAMLKALDVQNNANKNMIDLAKVLTNKDKGNGTNILVQAVSEKQAGISINNIRDSL